MIIENQNKFIEDLNNSYKTFSPKCPLVIPSYQNRSGTVLKNLKSLSDNKIILFIYDTDYPLYKQYENEQVEIVQIKENWRSIQKKRHWIQDYMANKRTEIKTYIMLDDDIRKGKLRTTVDGKKTSRYIPVKNTLGILEHLHTTYCNTVSCGAGTNLGLLGNHLYTDSPGYQVFCFNNDWVRKNPNCMFRDLQNVSEDNVLWFDCWKNDQPYCCFELIYFECASQRQKNYSSIASTPINIMKNNINAVRIIQNNCKLFFSKEWTSAWCIKYTKECIDYWGDIKTILDRNMPNWNDLSVTYSINVYTAVYDEIKTYLETVLYSKPQSAVDDFLS